MNLRIPCFVLLSVSACAAAIEGSRVAFLRTPDGGIQPQAAVDAKGVLHLIYFKGEPKGGDIFYVHRSPRGSEFSRPIRVNSQQHTAMAIGTIRGAQLAVGKNGRVHVAWNGMGAGGDAAFDSATPKHGLLYTRLNDAGTAFEIERNVITFAYGLDGGSSVAADGEGNVYVAWHAPKPGNTNGEAGRAVFIARSSNEGKTFEREKLAISEPTGACGCCGMRAFADSGGAVYILYRGAGERVNRNETLLISRDQGRTFEIGYSHPWKVSMCPMSSATISETGKEVLVAAETHGRVFFIRVDRDSGKVSDPISPEKQAKYPVALATERGETLLLWAEGAGWNRGGIVVYEVFNESGTTVEKGRADGLPVWSLPTAFMEKSGRFTVVY